MVHVPILNMLSGQIVFNVSGGAGSGVAGGASRSAAVTTGTTGATTTKTECVSCQKVIASDQSSLFTYECVQECAGFSALMFTCRPPHPPLEDQCVTPRPSPRLRTGLL